MAISDAATEKTCLEEISHLILDAGKKVTLPLLSHNHGLPFIKCSEILDQWVKSNKDKVSCSYYVEYEDENGNPVVTIVSSDKLKALKDNQKNKKITQKLYGIWLTTTNRTTGLKESFDNVHIPIKANFNLRNVEQRPALPKETEPKIHIKAEKVTNAGTKNISNMFSNKSTSSKEVKKEVDEPKLSPVKKEVEKKESPAKKKVSPKKAKATVSGQGKIASFFSKAPVKPATTKSEPIVKSEPVAEKPTTSTNNPISSIIDSDDDDDEVVAGTPQEKVRQRKAPVKKVPTKSKQHSRIAVLEDSSESEVEEEREMKRQEQEIELHVSDTEETESKVSPEKEKKSEVKIVSGPETTGNKRRKGIRTVLRKYEDEEGFMVTRKETEEYYLSDEEESSKKKPKLEVEMKSEPKTELKPAPSKTKQKNIMSFFNRK